MNNSISKPKLQPMMMAIANGRVANISLQRGIAATRCPSLHC
jgi:hypothetical protein